MELEQFPLMVPGAKEHKEWLTVYAPYNHTPIAKIACADDDTIELALHTAQQLFTDRKNWLPLVERLAILERAITLIQEKREFLALEAAREGGKPLSDSLVEVDRAIDGVKICIETMRTHAGQVVPMQITPSSAARIAFTQYEPIGVVLAISAFNHPVNLIIHQVAPAIAAGCPVIVKPASNTPLSCARLVQIFHQAGLPTAWCQMLIIKDTQKVAKLAEDPRLGFLTFIGSANVGWQLRARLAPGVRCSLEHGGVAPVIVLADAKLDKTIAPLVKGGYYHAGQVCVSVQRVYVDDKICNEFIQAFTEQVEQLKVGDPTDISTAVGPLIRPEEVERIAKWVDETIAQGAILLTGGKKLSDTTYAPTVLLNPPPNLPISVSEVFGPVVCIYSYTDLKEALALANSLNVGFQAAVFGQDFDQLLYCYEVLNASTVMLNDHTAFRVDWMPFAGLRHSGLGTGGIPYSIRDMQIEKMLVMHSKNVG